MNNARKRLPRWLPAGTLLAVAGVMLSPIAARAQTTPPATYPAGQTTVSGPDTLQTSGTTTIGSGSDVTYKANSTITLKPGFTVTTGGIFRAMINYQQSLLTSAPAISGVANTAFTYQVTGSNSPTSITVTGLPAGLSYNSGTAQITGTPTTAGNYFVTITLTNYFGSSQTQLLIGIAAAGTDSDGDGVPNAYEYAGHTQAGSVDATNTTVQLKVTNPQ